MGAYSRAAAEVQCDSVSEFLVAFVLQRTTMYNIMMASIITVKHRLRREPGDIAPGATRSRGPLDAATMYKYLIFKILIH